MKKPCSQSKNKMVRAICMLHDRGGELCGVVEFSDMPAQTRCHVVYFVTGLSLGLHGFHIHEFGDPSEGCASMGGHYNPRHLRHGGRHSDERHAGDLGNIEADATGEALGSFSISGFNVSDILGRGLVVHADADDLGKFRDMDNDSATTGNAGARVCCGVIARASPPFFNNMLPSS